jgi:hypothetical protein
MSTSCNCGCPIHCQRRTTDLVCNRLCPCCCVRQVNRLESSIAPRPLQRAGPSSSRTQRFTLRQAVLEPAALSSNSASPPAVAASLLEEVPAEGTSSFEVLPGDDYYDVGEDFSPSTLIDEQPASPTISTHQLGESVVVVTHEQFEAQVQQVHTEVQEELEQTQDQGQVELEQAQDQGQEELEQAQDQGQNQDQDLVHDELEQGPVPGLHEEVLVTLPSTATVPRSRRGMLTTCTNHYILVCI